MHAPWCVSSGYHTCFALRQATLRKSLKRNVPETRGPEIRVLVHDKPPRVPQFIPSLRGFVPKCLLRPPRSRTRSSSNPFWRTTARRCGSEALEQSVEHEAERRITDGVVIDRQRVGDEVEPLERLLLHFLGERQDDGQVARRAGGARE